jgi:hypothetical protein
VVKVISLQCLFDKDVACEFWRKFQQHKPLFAKLEHMELVIKFQFSSIFEQILDNKFQVPITRITIDMNSITLQQIILFEQVLQKYCNNLESLTIKLPPIQNVWDFRLPTLPKVTELEIDYNDSSSCGYGLRVLGTLLFGEREEIVEYNKNFPILKILSINFCTEQALKLWDAKTQKHVKATTQQLWKKYRPCFEILFPSNMTVCPQIQRLNFPHIGDGKGKDVLEILKQLAEKFPNVHNPFVNKTRIQIDAAEKRELNRQEKEEMKQNAPTANKMTLRVRKNK